MTDVQKRVQGLLDELINTGAEQGLQVAAPVGELLHDVGPPFGEAAKIVAPARQAPADGRQSGAEPGRVECLQDAGPGAASPFHMTIRCALSCG